MKVGLNFWGVIFYLFLIVCGVLVSGLALQLASSLIPPLDASIGVMQYVLESNTMAPIRDIMVSDNGTCPKDFEQLILGIWPGSRLGCYIEQGIISESCIEPDIPAQPEKHITQWGNLAFCVKRNIDYEVNVNIGCTKGYISCSRELCVSDQEKCPITTILPQTQEDTMKTGNETLNLQNGKIFTVQRNPTEQPIYDLETSILGKPCYAKGYAPNKTNPYQLLEIQYKCGEYGEDLQADILDSMGEIDLYLVNGFGWILQELRGYNESIEGDQVYLVARHRPALLQEAVCYDDHSRNSELNSLEVIDVWGEWIYTLSMLELLAVVPLGMFLQKDTQSKGSLWRLGVAIKVALFNPISIVTMVFYLRIYLILAGVKDSSVAFRSLADKYCFIDNQLNQAAFDFSELVKNYYYPNYRKIGLIVWFLSLRSLISIFMAFYKDNQTKGEFSLSKARHKSHDQINWVLPGENMRPYASS